MLTLAEGPIGIETQAHVDSVAMPLRALVETDNADAFVIACYTDPGLPSAARRRAARIRHRRMRCTYCPFPRRPFRGHCHPTALVRRHLRYLRQMGLRRGSRASGRST